jgi:hypothetical protein
VARPRHPCKEIEAAVQHAEELGWRVTIGGSHAWGFLWCPRQDRNGCRRRVDSTPKNPEGYARLLLRIIDRCPHRQEAP